MNLSNEESPQYDGKESVQMYQVGELIIYGPEGVCRVDAVGPLAMRGARKGIDYYTLSPLGQGGQIYAPVDSSTSSRPVMTRDEALALIEKIPDVPAEVCDLSNPRLLGEHYQVLLGSGDCLDLVRLLREIYAKGREAEARGRRLSQVDLRSRDRAEKMLHGELSVSLEIPLDEVRDYIARTIEARANA